MVTTNSRDETVQRWRQSMLDETSRFIEWGLQNPEKITWIPKHRVGAGHFTERLKNIFWALALNEEEGP